MKRSILILCVLLILLTWVPASAFAAEEPLTPGDVVERAGAFDGASVTMQGEAIGESLRADGDHRWVNVLGGGAAVGVFMPQEMAEEIEHFGLYSHFGDTIAVRGLVNVSCEEHGGEFDIHAEELMIIEPGGARENPAIPWKLPAGLALLALGLVEYRVYRHLKNRAPA